ncbi:hypothetical protein Cgig2_027041 [Carnegiea gigantea]|uniref:Pentatricopeptide repeat-containing protein n=1 Tax=Carnegiea gigantea TaxID=171969 RepID=A0A9Q1K924_9CARY|nr:hypothetical protein Cgig2_027041 [Carnegiea gigantea]
MLSLFPTPSPSIHKARFRIHQPSFIGPSTQSSKRANRCRNQSLPLGISSNFLDYYGEISSRTAIISNSTVSEVTAKSPVGEPSDSRPLSRGLDPVWLASLLQSPYRLKDVRVIHAVILKSLRLDYELGRQVHAHCIKGRWSNLIADSAILYLYAQCGDWLSAFQIFDRMNERDVVSWTTIICSCSQQGFGKQALSLFAQMFVDEYLPNGHTICSVLKACGEEKELKFGRLLHAIVVKKLIQDDVFVGTSLAGMYFNCGEIEDSRKVFDRMKRRNMVTWTSIITGYARNGLGYEALALFRVMKRRKVVANNLTTVSILRACGSIGALLIAKEVHAQVLKISAQNNIYIGSTLVWLYCKCGDYALASKVLQKMPLRDVVSWTAIISGCARLGHEFEALEFLKEMLGCARNGYCHEALKLMYQMQAEGFQIDDYIVTTVLISVKARGILKEVEIGEDGSPDFREPEPRTFDGQCNGRIPSF